MAVNWPLSLPQQPASYTEQKAPVTIHSQPDTGPRKSRRRYTRAVTKGQMTFLLTIAQAITLDNFWTHTMQSGAEKMNFLHPWRGTTVQMLVPDAPKMVDDGPLAVRVTLDVEFFQ